jgi:hypothetical protein
MPNNATAPSIRCAGQSVHANVRGARATTLDAGARTMTGQDADALGATAVGVPSTTSPTHCWPKASGRWSTGCSPPSWCASRVPRGASPENWASIALRAPAGAGGCALRPCPLRCSARWRARSQPMRSLRGPATRDKRHMVGRRREDAARVVAARSVSPAEAMMIKIDQRSARGSVARGLSSSKRPALAP